MIYLNVPDICQTVQDSLIITVKQNVRFQRRICPAKMSTRLVRNGRLLTIIDFIMCNITKAGGGLWWQLASCRLHFLDACYIAKIPLYDKKKKQICSFN